MTEDHFSGNHEPRLSCNQGGDGRKIPPGGGNVAGEDDPRDSNSSSGSDDCPSSFPDMSKFL